MTDFTTARLSMVESQVRANRVIDDRIIAAMRTLPREVFLPAALHGIAYVDEDLPLGGGRFAVEPMVLSRLLQALELTENDRVLVVGANGGYSAAIAAQIARSVVALESEERLAALCAEAAGRMKIANLVPVRGPLAEGHQAGAPYDAILIEGAVEELPPALLGQLADGGRLACMFRGTDGIARALLVTERDGVFGRRVLFDAGTPLLPGFARPRAFAL